jgi:peroxiredoxin
MRMQEDSIQDHPLNSNALIKSLLDTEAVKFARYDLGDIDDNKKDIILDDAKLYLLDFWFLRCPPCLRDHKRMQNDYSIFKENNVTLISISKDDNYESWRNYLNKHDFPWINLREQDPEIRLTYDLSIWSYPAYVLINSKGTIQKRFNGFAQFQQYINNKKLP